MGGRPQAAASARAMAGARPGPCVTYDFASRRQEAWAPAGALTAADTQVRDRPHRTPGETRMPLGRAGRRSGCAGRRSWAGYRNRAGGRPPRCCVMAGFTPAILACWTTDGYLFDPAIARRTWSIVGGFNVYPREVEEVLCAHAAVTEAAVIGVADSYRGESLRALMSL